MTVGMCSCEVGKDGSPCKHQYVLWCSNIAHSINFVPVAQPDVRQKLAWIAIGESLPLSHYQPLRDQVGHKNQDSDCLAVPVSADVQTLQPENCTGQEIPDEVASEDSGDDSQDTFIASAAEMLRKSCDQIADKLRSTRDRNLAKGIVKFSKRVMTLTTSQAMHSDLTAALFDFGTSETRKSGKGKKLESNQIERGNMEMGVVRLFQKDDQLNSKRNYRFLQEKQSAVMIWLKLCNQIRRVVKNLQYKQ